MVEETGKKKVRSADETTQQCEQNLWTWRKYALKEQKPSFSISLNAIEKILCECQFQGKLFSLQMLRHRDLLFAIVPIDVTVGRGKAKVNF